MNLLHLNLGILILFLLAFVTTAGGDTINQLGRKTFFISRNQSAWQGFTDNYEQEQAGKKIAAIPMTQDLETLPHLASYTVNGFPFLAIDRVNKRVVVNAALFKDLQRPDTTRLRPGDKVVMGDFIVEQLQIKPGELVAFLLESQLIETYQHLEATVQVRAEEDSPVAYWASFQGTHLYFTNDRNEDPVAFRVTIDKKTGEILVTGE